jgi:hypothetical protein
MTKIAIVPNAAGTGTFTIEAPNSNSNRTLVLPDAAGTVMTDATTLLTSQLPAQLSVSSSAAAGSFALDASGRVTTPFQPVVSMHRTTSQTASGVIIFDGTRTNTGSHYNTTNGRFTAPVGGKYYCSIQGVANAGSTVVNFSWRKNGAAFGGWANVNDANTSVSSAVIIDCNSGDYIEAFLVAGQLRQSNGDNNQLNIFLIG